MADAKSTIVVTGASRGIGKAIAERFADAGHTVWALSRGATTGSSTRIKPLAVDVAKPEAILAACGKILDGGAPAVLINNAGIALSAPFSKTSLEDYERVMDINARAPFLFCRELVPAMVKAGGGRIINVASTAALKGFKYTVAYCASKHALLGLTRALAVELAQKGVTVNAVCPGWTDTDMLKASAEKIAETTGRSEKEARDALAKMNPMARLILPEEVAELCFFLASPAAAGVTGSVYPMDGGESA